MIHSQKPAAKVMPCLEDVPTFRGSSWKRQVQTLLMRLGWVVGCSFESAYSNPTVQYTG